jgi:hypothetical protein
MSETDVLTRRVRRSTEHIETEVDGEVVLMQFSSGAFFSMDDTARTVWHQIEDGRTVREIIEHLADHFDGEASVIAADTVLFLRDLESNGIIHFE